MRTTRRPKSKREEAMAILIRAGKAQIPRNEGGQGWRFASLFLRCGRRELSVITSRMILMIVAGVSVNITPGIQAQSNSPSEYQVKAAFIYNFAKFVEWPSVAADPDSKIVIGILGEDPFGREMEGVIDGKTANGKRLAIKRFSDLRAVSHCHILFISSSERKNLRQILASAGPGILTVGETENFARLGGIINFTILDGKLRLEINRASAGRAGLKISAKLLSLARIIGN